MMRAIDPKWEPFIISLQLHIINSIYAMVGSITHESLPRSELVFEGLIDPERESCFAQNFILQCVTP